MQASPAAAAVLEQAEGLAKDDVAATTAFCSRIHAVISAASHQREGGHEAASSATVPKCLTAAHKQLSGAAPAAQAQLMGVLTRAVQDCAFSQQLTQAISGITPDLLDVVKRGEPSAVAAACACYDAIAARAAQHLATPATRSWAAQALASAVTAALHLLPGDTSPLQHHGFELVCGLADAMPQLLKSHAATICAACFATIVPAGSAPQQGQRPAQSTAPMATRLLAAHALARLACASGTPEGWAAHTQGLLIAMHQALAALPMPDKDNDVLHAAQDVLGAPAAPAWAAFSATAPQASLADRVEVATLLLHCLSVTLTSKSAALAPLPMSALVLLVSRLLSLREKPAVANESVVAQCQWPACASALLASGAHLGTKWYTMHQQVHDLPMTAPHPLSIESSCPSLVQCQAL